MAEVELSVLARQCLAHRLPHRRHAAIHTIDWPFTTDDARTKLRRLYPLFEA